MDTLHTVAELKIVAGYCRAPLELPRVKRQIKDLWRKKFGALCQSCGGRMSFSSDDIGAPNQATVDHITARALGGTDFLDNLQVICLACNNRKSQAESDRAQGREPKQPAPATPAVTRASWLTPRASPGR